MDIKQQAFVVVLKRRTGDTPKVEKISKLELHLTREDADAAHAQLPSGMVRACYEVREISVEFLPCP